MYRYSIIVVFALYVAACSQTAGAQPIALKQAESEAVSNNISLLAQKYEISTADADIVTAHILPNNPYLVLYGDILPTGGSYSVDNKYWGGSVVFPIELGGKRDASVAVAENNKEVTTAAFEDAMRTLILTVRTSFYDALAAKANLQLATEDQTALDSVVALNRIRVQAKDIPESDLMRSEIAAEQTRVDLQSAQIDYEKARFNLQIAMGRKNLSPDFDITGDLTALPDPPALSLEEAKQAAREHRPDLKSLQDQLATNEANERLQDALASIDISISADYLVQQGAVFWGSTLTVPIPVFNRNQGERQKASVRTMQSQKQIEALEQQVDADVETAYREFTTRQMIVHKMQDSILTRAKEVRSSVEYAYKTGGTTILDFLDAEREYRDAVKSYNDALVALQKSAFALRAAMGQIN